MHLLFVCTGNICRSPLGERLTRAFAQAAGVDLTAESAGVRGVVGRSMDPSAATVLEGLGGDPRGFRARQLEATMADRADLVLVMEAAHRDAVLSRSPRALSRTFLLREAAPLLAAARSRAPGEGAPALLAEMHRRRGARGVTDTDVVDPIGCSLRVHQEVGEAIADALLPVLEVLAGAVGTGAGAPGHRAVE